MSGLSNLAGLGAGEVKLGPSQDIESGRTDTPSTEAEQQVEAPEVTYCCGLVKETTIFKTLQIAAWVGVVGGIALLIYGLVVSDYFCAAGGGALIIFCGCLVWSSRTNGGMQKIVNNLTDQVNRLDATTDRLEGEVDQLHTTSQKLAHTGIKLDLATVKLHKQLDNAKKDRAIYMARIKELMGDIEVIAQRARKSIETTEAKAEEAIHHVEQKAIAKVEDAIGRKSGVVIALQAALADARLQLRKAEEKIEALEAKLTKISKSVVIRIGEDGRAHETARLLVDNE